MGVTGPSEPWPETPRRASLMGRGSLEPLRSATPARTNGETTFGRATGASIASPAIVPLLGEVRHGVAHERPAGREHDRRVLHPFGDLPVVENARHDAVADRVDDDGDHEGEEQLRRVAEVEADGAA